MTRHFAIRKPPVNPQGEWLRLSTDMTWLVEEMSGLDDLVVRISPDAGYDDTAYNADGTLKEGAQQHPGVTFPLERDIEINGQFMPDGIDLSTVEALDRNDRKRYPVVTGLLAHEASHARHSTWLRKLLDRKLSNEENKWAGAATLLEEPRIEARQIGYRPADQVFLQASATNIAVAEATEGIKNAPPGAEPSKVGVSRMAVLILGRIDAGSVDPDDSTAELEKLARKTFGSDYGKLRKIWLEALNTADDDADAMLNLGRRWHELTGDDGGDGGPGQDGGEDGQGQGNGMQALSQALSDMLSKMSKLAGHAEGEANGENEARARKARIAKAARDRKAETEMAQDAAKQADWVFHAGPKEGGNDTQNPVRGYRDPTLPELTLARVTRRALQAAYVPDRAVTRASSQLPPGRLSARKAQQAQAQRQMGLVADAEPFQRKERRHVPVPPLKVGIIQDVSGSQGGAAAAAVSGAWSLAKAASMISDAEVAMVTFGDRVHSVIRPREKLPRVPILKTPGGSHRLNTAIKAIEGELNLMRPGSARLVVILTDGYHEESEIAMRDPALKRLLDAGVRVLWFVTDGNGYSSQQDTRPKVRGVSVYDKAMGQYDVIPKVINSEAVRALEK